VIRRPRSKKWWKAEAYPPLPCPTSAYKRFATLEVASSTSAFFAPLGTVT
jgi:hypothetical protein